MALLGLTFKAGTDDLRESPAIRLAKRLITRGASVAAFDPVASVTAIAGLAGAGIDVEGCATAQDACIGVDAVLVATEWPEFRQLDWRVIAPRMQGRLVADARHVVDVEEAGQAGLQVLVLGVTAPQRSPMEAA